MSGTPSTSTAPVVVIGAGVIGAAIAWELQRRGRPTVLIDRDRPGLGASFGNMASIAVTEFMPASRPAIWRQMPGWLLDPEGPVHLPVTYLVRNPTWFLKFLASGLPSRVRALEAAGASLCHRALDDTKAMLADLGMADMLSPTGCLAIYAHEREFAADRGRLDRIQELGFPVRFLDADALRQSEPALSAGIARAALLPNNRTIGDPHKLVVRLFETFLELGGRFETEQVVGLDRTEGALSRLHFASGRSIAAAEAVVAMGAHTGELSRLIGDPIPLETERGYHSQLMAPSIALKHSLIWPARGFMVSPTAGGIRIGGSVEFAGLDAAPDYRRSRNLVRQAAEILPGLDAATSSEWMGHRPALPDTIPVIGSSAKTRGIHYATGHGHLGLTHAATTARIIADLSTGQKPPLDISPFRVDRF